MGYALVVCCKTTATSGHY